MPDQKRLNPLCQECPMDDDEVENSPAVLCFPEEEEPDA